MMPKHTACGRDEYDKGAQSDDDYIIPGTEYYRVSPTYRGMLIVAMCVKKGGGFYLSTMYHTFRCAKTKHTYAFHCCIMKSLVYN